MQRAKIVEKIKSNDFWNSVVKLSSGTIIGQAITLVLTPILSRLYSTDSYGDQGIITSTATIIAAVIALGLNSAIMVQKDDDDSAKVLRVSVVIQWLLSFIVFGFLTFFSPFFKIFTTDIDYLISLLLCFLYVLVVTLYNAMRMYINRLKMNNVLFVNPIINALCTIVITLPLSFFDAKCVGLMLGVIVAFSVSCMHMISKANPFRDKIEKEDFKFVFSECKKFIIYQYPSNIVGISSAQLPNQVISNVYGSVSLGNYGMVTKLFHLPLNLIATPIQNVYFRTVSADSDSHDKIARFTYSLLTKICLIAAIPSLVLMVAGEPIFGFVLGQSWKQAGHFAGFLILPLVFQFCHECIAYCRVSIGKQRINLWFSIVNLFLIGGAIALGVILKCNVETTVFFYAIGNLLYQVLDIFVTFICLKKNASKWLFFSLLYICVIVFVAVLTRQFVVF